MDFDDLNMKLKRLYIAVDERYDQNIDENIVDSHVSFDNGYFEHITRFGANEPEKNQYIIMNAVHHIGLLKDIIKSKIKDPILYEQLINDNISLALITDLDNKDKHGNNLTNGRSGKNPRIQNIEQVLRGKGVTRASFTTNLTTGKTVLVDSEGDVKVVIAADVVDSGGMILMSLEKMLHDALNTVEKFMVSEGLIQRASD